MLHEILLMYYNYINYINWVLHDIKNLRGRMAEWKEHIWDEISGYTTQVYSVPVTDGWVSVSYTTAHLWGLLTFNILKFMITTWTVSWLTHKQKKEHLRYLTSRNHYLNTIQNCKKMTGSAEHSILKFYAKTWLRKQWYDHKV